MECSFLSLNISYFSALFKKNLLCYLSPSLPYFLYFEQTVNPNFTLTEPRMNCHWFHVGDKKGSPQLNKPVPSIFENYGIAKTKNTYLVLRTILGSLPILTHLILTKTL
jgi:hypothetical protein